MGDFDVTFKEGGCEERFGEFIAYGDWICCASWDLGCVVGAICIRGALSLGVGFGRRYSFCCGVLWDIGGGEFELRLLLQGRVC